MFWRTNDANTVFLNRQSASIVAIQVKDPVLSNVCISWRSLVVSTRLWKKGACRHICSLRPLAHNTAFNSEHVPKHIPYRTLNVWHSNLEYKLCFKVRWPVLSTDDYAVGESVRHLSQRRHWRACQALQLCTLAPGSETHGANINIQMHTLESCVNTPQEAIDLPRHIEALRISGLHSGKPWSVFVYVEGANLFFILFLFLLCHQSH